MSAEITIFVRVAERFEDEVTRLQKQATEALRRSAKLPPGDRSEIRRFESLKSAVEQFALASLWGNEPHIVEELGAASPAVSEWRDAGSLVIELRLPHGIGETLLHGEAACGPPPPAERWRGEDGSTSKIVQTRFRSLIMDALESETGRANGVIRPSGIVNSVLTDTLREFACRGDAGTAKEVPVRYLDGSFGPTFPFHSISLSEIVPEKWRELSFSLLSIRHVEMDHIVDGAWLRNAHVSQPRLSGLTDQLVYEVSLRQLQTLSDQGRTLIYMYQTGLGTAVVGFYRAVLRHLIQYPGSVAVIPMYYRGSKFLPGKVWATP